MNRLWIRIRLPLAIIMLIIMTLALARLFSGPEDAWILNEQGEWIAHGHPAGPPPPEGYREPASHLIIPVSFLVAFAVPLLLLITWFNRPQNRLTYDAVLRDQKWLGYVGVALLLFGALTGVGLLYEIAVSLDGTPGQGALLMGALVVFAGACGVVGMVFLALRRIAADHYALMKSQRELVEAIAGMGGDRVDDVVV